MCDSLRLALGGLRHTLRLMVGLPDYGAYVARRRLVHPGEMVMSETAFFRERQDNRYGVSAGRVSRCC
jgi:uncharacterized short protein YbdD (DUF466 family)